MKRYWLLLGVVLALCFLLPVAAEEPSEPDLPAEYSGRAALPGSLLSIGAEAFEGTALSEVRISESVTEIDDRAFAQIGTLRLLYIPRSVDRIGADILHDSCGVLITGSENSAARAWARQNRLPFSLEQLLTQAAKTRQFAGIPSAAGESGKVAARNEESCIAQRQARRPGRTVGELKASQFKGIAAQYIQSRFFP